MAGTLLPAAAPAEIDAPEADRPAAKIELAVPLIDEAGRHGDRWVDAGRVPERRGELDGARWHGGRTRVRDRGRRYETRQSDEADADDEGIDRSTQPLRPSTPPPRVTL